MDHVADHDVSPSNSNPNLDNKNDDSQHSDIASVSKHRKIVGGKYRRWITVLGAFIVVAVYDGTLSTTGVLMPTIHSHFEISRTVTSLLGPVIYGLPLFLGPLVCCLISVFGCRSTALAGCLILGLSFILSGFANSSFPLLFLTIGLLRSIGSSLMYSPAYVILPHWFPNSKRLGLAAGIAVCGSGFGGFILPPLLQYLLTLYGWMWALILFGGICFHGLIGAMFFKHPEYDETDDDLSESNDDYVDALGQFSKSDADLDTVCDLFDPSIKRVPSRDIYAALYKCSLSNTRREMLGAYHKDAVKHADQLRKQRAALLEGTCSMRSLSLPNVRLGIGLSVTDAIRRVSAGNLHKESLTFPQLIAQFSEEFRESIRKIFDPQLFTNKKFVLFLVCNTLMRFV